MSPVQRVIGLLTAQRSRWKPMFLGLGVAIVCIQAVALLKPPEPISGILVIVVLLAWLVGACAMVGYVRWLFASEVAQARRDNADASDDKSP
jgi:hypothetical protein